MSGEDRSSLQKGLAILQELSTAETTMSAGEIAAATGLNRATAYRLCEALEEAGWVQTVQESPRRRRVALGPNGLGFAVMATSRYGTEDRLQPLMQALAERLGETVQAGYVDGASVVHVARALPPSGPHMAVRLGLREDAHITALGKAILATKPTDELLALYPVEELATPTPRSLASRSELIDELQATAERGYALDDEESSTGVRCIAAPIFDHTGKGVMALSVTSMPVRLEGDRVEAVAREIQATAQKASLAFGGETPGEWLPRPSAAGARA
jgi:IclR family acetate operon transcriptional repressor